MPKNLQLAHELDAAWIIALWLAIHGGDPSPIELSAAVAERLANALIAALPEKAEKRASLSLRTLQNQMKGMRVQVTRGGKPSPKRGQAAVVEAENFASRPYCFKYKGQTYCVTIRAPHGPHPE